MHVPDITCKHKLPPNKPFKSSIVGWEKNFQLINGEQGRFCSLKE